MLQVLTSIIKKDLKLLLRSRSSTVAVLLGPLLVVLLVGLAFTNASGQSITIGVVEADIDYQATYLDSMIEAFTVIPYEEVVECEEDVKKGLIVSCVAFEQGAPPKARLYVDPSDLNVVYAVIDQITGKLESDTNEVRTGITDSLLDSTTKTLLKLEKDVEQLESAQQKINTQIGDLSRLNEEIDGIQFQVTPIKKWEVQRAIELTTTTRKEFQATAWDILEAYQGYIRKNALEEDKESDLSKTNPFQERLDEIDSHVEAQNDQVFVQILNSVGDVEDAVTASEEKVTSLNTQADQLASNLQSAKIDIDAVLASISQTESSLGNLDISRQDTKAAVEAVIEPVITEEDRFSFVFPMFIVLIAMFTATLLASSMIVRERKSEAYFRNFAAPVPDWLYVASTYCTTMLIILSQLLIIYVLASVFAPIPLARPLGLTILLILVITTFFTLLGMLVGYMFKKQEGVMLSAITIASVLLLVSNVVLPIKTLPGPVSFLVKANPFVMSSSMLKATTIFSFGFADIASLFFAMLLYCVMLFAIIMIVQRIARIRYFELAGSAEKISHFLQEQSLPQERALILGRQVIRTKEELLATLESMRDSTYEKYASHKENIIADWIADVYKDEILAKHLQNKSRHGAIDVLKKHLR